MAESPEQDLQLLTAGKLDMLIDYLRRHHKIPPKESPGLPYNSSIYLRSIESFTLHIINQLILYTLPE